MIKLAQIWRRKQATPASQFVSTLNRVRDIREHSGWDAPTPPSSIQQRADRVAEARAHIKIPPLGSEHEIREPQQPDLLRWIIYPVAGVIAVALAQCIAVPEAATNDRVRQASIVFPAGQYTNLTEAVAEGFARRALVSAGAKWDAWDLTHRYTNDAENVIAFHYADDLSTVLRVIVKLESSNERIVCTIIPQ